MLSGLMKSDFTINRKSYESLRFFLLKKLRSNLMIRLRTFLLICLPLLILGSCAYEQKVLVYEKIPQSPECMRFSDYLEVAACEQEQLKRQNVELQVSLRESYYRLERIHNQGDRCAIQNRGPRPAGCAVRLIPSRQHQYPPENFQSNPYIFPGNDHR